MIISINLLMDNFNLVNKLEYIILLRFRSINKWTKILLFNGFGQKIFNINKMA